MVTDQVRVGIRIEGTVQGVGFRPFVYGLATRLGLAGLVGNDGEGVFAEVEGSRDIVARFMSRLECDAPPLATIERVTVRDLTPDGTGLFVIVPSQPAAARRALVAADSATCADCLRELNDPADRRYRYPFINCTNCGPRFTIIRDVPYDRSATTMAGFAMCDACAAEYHDPADRRFHAQPVCCPACGPGLILTDRDGNGVAASRPAVPGRAPSERVGPPGDPVVAAATLLRDGLVLAVKGLGGYHLAVDAASEEATAALRERKHREDKPFAVMVSDLESAGLLCEVDATAADLLTSARRPIVLLPFGGAGSVASAVAPGNRQLGVMLPYTALHHLLLAALARPIVLTSGNVSDEPISYHDEDALHRLGGIADAFLRHDRPIHIRTDDSVVGVFRGRTMPIRRSRGYAPEPITVRSRFGRPVLACGGELKNTFCLAKDNRAIVSHHIGDLENAETLRAFTEGIEHLKRLFDVEPELVAHDLHPDYLSTKYAAELDGVDLIGVQHHHAHVASCLADNDTDGPVIGVAFDGTGYGSDDTIWGGEFLIANLTSFSRAGHLACVPMPGGAAAIRQPWRMAAAYLDEGGLAEGGHVAVACRQGRSWHAVLAMARQRVNSPLTSSAGRLFDAAAAVLGVRDEINYEGQAAIELEQLADPAEHAEYRATISAGPPFVVHAGELIEAVTGDLARGVNPSVIAGRFHNGVAALIEDGCVLARERSGVSTVALSGGVFQNRLLLRAAVDRLEARGFAVLVHSRVPCNDGGISLGQAVVAAAIDGAGAPPGAARRLALARPG